MATLNVALIGQVLEAALLAATERRAVKMDDVK